MQLDDRKMKILQAIIRNYLETGEPVGSRTISKYTDLNLSSATIRNEMSDLEELGYLDQPHTSAGRVPSNKAYRLYVDRLMKVGKLPADFVEGMVCVGGCVGGPSKHKSELEAKKARDLLIGQADGREVHENLKNLGADKVAMHRH